MNGFLLDMDIKNIYRLLPIMALVVQACVYEHVSPIAQNTPCNDTLNISYIRQILPILKENCWSCHDNKNHFGGIRLENFADVQSEAQSGELLESIISYNGNEPRMPKGGQLTTCQIALFRNWIKQGSKNN
jgi:hypothetical protein